MSTPVNKHFKGIMGTSNMRILVEYPIVLYSYKKMRTNLHENEHILVIDYVHGDDNEELVCFVTNFGSSFEYIYEKTDSKDATIEHANRKCNALVYIRNNELPQEYIDMIMMRNDTPNLQHMRTHNDRTFVHLYQIAKMIGKIYDKYATGRMETLNKLKKMTETIAQYEKYMQIQKNAISDLSAVNKKMHDELENIKHAEYDTHVKNVHLKMDIKRLLRENGNVDPSEYKKMYTYEIGDYSI